MQYKADTVNPVNTSAVAPTAWQTPSLSLALTGTDAASGIDHGEWRVNGGTVKTGSTAVVTSEGTQSFETRVVDKAGNASPWRPETIKVDHTAPTNTTAQPTSAWRNTDYARSSPASTPPPACSASSSRSTAGRRTTRQRVDHRRGRAHARLADRRQRRQRFGLAHGHGRHRPHGPGAGRRLRHHRVAQLAADCSVSATGGALGPGERHRRRQPPHGRRRRLRRPRRGRPDDPLPRRGRRRQRVRRTAEVKIDTSAPAPAVNCVPDAGTAWTCSASASDSVSGVGSMAYSVDGAAPAPINNGDTFTVAKGSVTVYATDNAGNGAASGRRARRPLGPGARRRPRAAVHSEAVLLRKGGAAAARLVGQLAISSLPTSTTVDLRPLAIGKGSFQFVFKVTTGSKTKTVTKTQKVKPATRRGSRSRSPPRPRPP